MSKEFKEGNITVAVFGLGKMGLPLATVFADRGAQVIGVDINENVVEQIKNGVNHVKEEPGLRELVEKNVEAGRLSATTDGVEAAKKADVCVILVPTLTDDRGNVKMGPVLDVAETISKGLEKGNVVVTEATMPPGNTEKLLPILEGSGLKLGEFGLGHAPERTMTGTAIRDIKGQYPKIIGADSEGTLQVLKGIYDVVNEKGTIEMKDILSAEAVKVFEGIYRDVNIALANELALYCGEKGIDSVEIIEAANSQDFCHLHEPGAGVAGHCIPVYPWFVINQSKGNSELIRKAREINDSMPYRVVDLVTEGLERSGVSVRGSNVLVLGLTFRGGVREFMKTPAKPVIGKLNELGVNTFAYDPMCGPADAERYGAGWKEDYSDVDAVVILTDHEEFMDLDMEKLRKEARNTVIIDGRNVLKVDKIKGNGFEYFRVDGPHTT